MRVVHVSKVTGIAGSEGHLLNLLPGLRKYGIYPHMIVLIDPNNPVEKFCTQMQAQGVPCENMVIRHHIDLTLAGQLRERFQQIKADIVHTHLLHADVYGLHAAGQANVPYRVSSRHNDDRFRRMFALKWLNQLVAQKAQRVIAISEALERFVIDVEGIPAEKVQTIHYGLHAERGSGCSVEEAQQILQVDMEGPVLLFIGRLIEQKGVDVLLEAFATLRSEFPEVQLRIVGDGNLRARLETQCRTLGLEKAVRFLGWVEDAQRLMLGGDIIVVPSRWEGFGLVTLEAMRHRRPLVASAVSALPEIIVDGETGYLVPADDLLALTDALHKLLADPELARQMGRAGHQRLVEVFSVEKMVKATADLYHKIAEIH